MNNRYLHKHKWIAVLLCLCFMMSFILPGYAMDGGVDAGGGDVSVSDGGSSGDSGSGDIGSGDTGSGGSTGGTTTPPTEGGTTTPPTEGGTTTLPTEGGATTPPTEGGTTTPPTEGGTTTPPTEGGTTPPPTEGGTTPPQQPTECTCGTTTGVHGVDCPLYEAPECNCGTTTDVHAEGCPLYVPPVPVLPGGIHHVEGCTDEECTVENCTCPCHAAQALFERLMACGTIEEIDEIFAGVTEEEMAALALLSEEKQIMLNEYITALEPEPLPPVFIESEPPVPSEIVFAEEDEIVNMTDVAPFKEPVAGPVLARPMRVPGLLAAGESDNGLTLSKTATANDDGSYTIQLEAYATGDKVITEVTEDVPTDIVLVLDQSGSMANDMGTVSFREYYFKQNSYYYEKRHNGGEANLWYPLENGKYASVSVTVKNDNMSYTEITEGRNNDDGDWSNRATNYWENRNNLYAKVNGEYQKVTVTRRQNNNGRYVYTYTLPNGDVIATSERNSGEPSFYNIDGGRLYLASADVSQNVYTYTYTDAAGETQTIGTSTGANASFGTTLYQRNVNPNGGGSRINALKNALINFTDAVNKKAAGEDKVVGTEDDINHRIAVVGYAYGSEGYGDAPAYTNTEVFIGNVQYGYGNSAQSVYNSAFQSMNTTDGQNNVTASISALTANGATYTDLGVEMANGILDANPVSSGEKRNRVVIVFTDGQPGWSGYEDDVANDAINKANTIKNAGASVYTVGIFAGADASTAGDANGNDTEKSNWFMQNMSSNNGEVQDPSYYLSAADADSLNDIFQQISDQIQEGGTSSTLTGEAVIKDIISPQFTLPEGANAADITLETYSYTGEDQWEKNADAMGAKATVNGDKVDVTGFDFSKNYVGTVTEGSNVTYRGDKLVISFTVKAKDDFLGGNNVYTNTSAGIYESSSASQPIQEFERPQVNVPIKAITVGAVDKNVYLLNGLTAEELRSGATAKVGDVLLNLTKPGENYGLEAWQTAGVDISVVIKNAAGNVVNTNLTDLREDTTYNVIVQVSPKETALHTSSGTAAATQSGTATANINVFKPELTFKDSEVYYGDTVPTDFTDNLTDTKWKHGTTEADTSKMGEAPELALTYTPDATKILEGKINTKGDINVAAKVKIGETDITDKTTFVHTPCTDGCGWTEPTTKGNPAFLLHPKTCQLTITKKGGADNEPYVFDVYKDGAKYSEVTIIGNNSKIIYELPVGKYTIQEKTDWSWRYTANNGGTASLTSTSPTGSITCTNSNHDNKWLNGYSNVIENIFGVAH